MHPDQPLCEARCCVEHLDTAPQFCGLKHDYERYSRQMPLQTNCATFEGESLAAKFVES
jgi:hypothetical protein